MGVFLLRKDLIIWISIWAIVTTVALTAIFVTDTANAGNSSKVTICHATSSVNNPYTLNTVDDSSIDNEKNKYLNGHGDHTGPVFDINGGKDQPRWGDIIPPFTSPSGSSFAGYNWTEAGKSIWNSECNIVKPTPTPTPSPTPTPTPSPTPTPTPSPTPTPTPSPTPPPPPPPTTPEPPRDNPPIVETPTESSDTIIPEEFPTVIPSPEEIPQPEETKDPEVVPPPPTSIPAGGGGTIRIPSLK